MQLSMNRVASRPMLSRSRARMSIIRSSASYEEPESFSSPDILSQQPGDKIKEWMKTPFDFLAFGPRAGAGALLSLPDRLQNLQNDMQRLSELAQDPRPLNEKQEVLFKEVESIMVECLEKGATVEQDVLANVKSFLPAEAASVLDDIIPPPPNRAAWSASPVDVQPQAEYSQYTSTAPDAPAVMYGQSDVMASQVDTPTSSSADPTTSA